MTTQNDLHLSLQQLTNCISRITDKPDGGAGSLNEFGESVVCDLHDSLRDSESEETAAVLVRFFYDHSVCQSRRDCQDFYC